MPNVLERLLKIVVLAAVLLAPTQWSFAIRPAVRIAPADALVALASGLLLLLALRRRIEPRVPLPSLFAVLVVFCGLLSIPGARARLPAVKESVQYGLYLVAAWSLFRYAFADARLRENVLTLAAITAIVTVGAALTQFFRSGVPDLGVRAFFGNRNVLAGYLSLAVPFAYAQTLASRNPLLAFAGLLLALAGLAVTLSGAAVLAIVVALLVMAALESRLALALTLAFALFVALVLHPNLPRREGLAESWLTAESRRDPWLDSIALHAPDGALERRYPEWETAWLMAWDHPWRGVGAGNYQRAIRDLGYRRIPTRPGEPEPDTQNLYLVLAATIGIPGALAFFAMLLEGLAAAARTLFAGRRATAEDRPLALGALGALLAFAIAAVWHPLLVRGLGLLLVGTLALTHHLHDRTCRE